jgi:hypothetical protein
MRLSYKAHRLVAEALRDQPAGPDRAQLGGWLERGSDVELPPHIARLAVGVLDAIERDMMRRLDLGSLDEDQRSDVINDVRYVMSVKETLRREMAAKQPA